MLNVKSRARLMNLPNILTFLRIIAIPVVVLVYYLPYDWRYLVAAGVFSAASITDWLDGYLARKWEQSTPLGAFLDPVADKLIVAAALVMLVEAYSTPWFGVPAMIIICREITVSALREWMAEMGKRASVAVSYVGKVKTTLQMVAIIGLLAFPPDLGNALVLLSLALFYGATLLTIWSMYVYLQAAWGDLTEF
jgi:CDP-diacylglycerol--glycerol-3-phosphate 3-phosphatidyltransferase